VLGLPLYTQTKERVRGDAARPPAATLALDLLAVDEEKAQRAIELRIVRADGQLQLEDHNGGCQRPYKELTNFLMRCGQAVLAVGGRSEPGAAPAAEGEGPGSSTDQLTRAAAAEPPSVAAAADTAAAAEESGAPDLLISAAALPHSYGSSGSLLAGNPVPLSVFSRAALSEGAAATDQLISVLLVSSSDALDASQAMPLLMRLGTRCFLAAVHACGVDLAGAGLFQAAGGGNGGSGSESGGDEEDGGSDAAQQAEAGAAGWLDKFVAAADASSATTLEGALRALLQSGVVSEGTAHSALFQLRVKLRNAGVDLASSRGAHITASRKLKLGGGDGEEKSAQVDAAIDAWREELAALGAGPVPGMLAVNMTDSK
jgi:hypothetical protein